MKLHSLPPIFLLFCSQMLNKPVWGLGAGDPLPLMIFQYKIHHFWQQKQLILCLNRKFGVLRHSWNLRIRKQTKQTKKPEFLCNADVLMWKNSIDLQKSLKRNHSWIFFFFFLKWTARIEKSFIIRSFSGSFNAASKCLYILMICRVSGYFWNVELGASV